MRQRADESPLVAASRQHGQLLTDLNAGGFRRDRLKFAADARRAVGLGIEAVLLGQAAGEENVDYRLRFDELLPILCRGCMAERREVIDSEAQNADRTGLNHRAAREV